MSAPTETGQDPNPSPASEPGAGANGSSGAESQASRGYLEKARSDPEWAARTLAEYQGRADKAEAEKKALSEKVGPLEQYLEQFGGDQIAAALKDYGAIYGDQALAEAIKVYRETGKLPGARSSSVESEDDDDYLTDEQKEIRALKAELEDTQSRLSRQESGAGQQALRSHLEGIYDAWPFPQEVRERVEKVLSERITSLASQGKGGRALLEGMTGPKGRETVKGIVLSQVTDDEILQASQNAALRKKQGLSRLATDSPSGRSDARVETPKFKTPEEAAVWAREHLDQVDSR